MPGRAHLSCVKLRMRFEVRALAIGSLVLSCSSSSPSGTACQSGATAGTGGACQSGTGGEGTAGTGIADAGDAGASGAGAGDAGASGAGAGDAGASGAGAGDAGASGAGAGDAGAGSGGAGGAGAGSGGAAGSGCPTLPSTSGLTVLWSFGSDASQWLLAFSEPSTLLGRTALTSSAQLGSPQPPSLRIDIPFDGPSQKLELEAPAASLNLTGATLNAYVHLETGFSTDPSNPGRAKLYVKSNPGYVFADGGFNALIPGCWQMISMNLAAPVMQNPNFNPANIVYIGVEFATGGSAATAWSSAAIQLDTVGR